MNWVSMKWVRKGSMRQFAAGAVDETHGGVAALLLSTRGRCCSCDLTGFKACRSLDDVLCIPVHDDFLAKVAANLAWGRVTGTKVLHVSRNQEVKRMELHPTRFKCSNSSLC